MAEAEQNKNEQNTRKLPIEYSKKAYLCICGSKNNDTRFPVGVHKNTLATIVMSESKITAAAKKNYWQISTVILKQQNLINAVGSTYK